MNLLMFRSTFLFENLPVAADGLVRSRNLILFTTKQRSFLQVAKWMDGWLDGRPKIKMVNGDAVTLPRGAAHRRQLTNRAIFKSTRLGPGTSNTHLCARSLGRSKRIRDNSMIVTAPSIKPKPGAGDWKRLTRSMWLSRAWMSTGNQV